MAERNHYDVIVVGAGPAGLSIASELSKSVSTLVIDKKARPGTTTRSWFVPTFVLEEAGLPPECHYPWGVRKFITNTFAGGYNEWPARLPGGYRFIKEKETLEHWSRVVNENGRNEESGGAGSKTLYNCICYNHTVHSDTPGKAGYVEVSTHRGTFTARLLIDASGYDSPIKKRYYDLTRDETYWWSVYGWVIDHADGLPAGMEIGDYLLWGTFETLGANLDESLEEGRPVMEYEVLDERTTFPMVLYLRKSKVSEDVMRSEFDHIINREELGRPFRNIARKHKQVKVGWYPSGGVSQGIARNRVAFVGDAGVWSTPCGWGMGFVLTNFRKYAKAIAGRVQEDCLDAETLKSYVRMASWEQMEILVDQLAAHFLSHAGPELIDRFIEFWNKPGMNFLLCEKLFTLTITEEELEHILVRFVEEFDLKEIAATFPGEDLSLLFRTGAMFLIAGLPPRARLLLRILRTLTTRWNSRPFDRVVQRKLHALRRDLGFLLRPKPAPDGTQPLENGFDFLDYDIR